ncbi:zwei Ig domain protein zig-8-like [Pieris rapae]|uniref:zwei Ig domain protein zig-8-like n=1 Tax=Pieris rapae TaxID=64459 RepID=UPI001E27D15D|nr:zwei Ig domain protein zig-8-like [Pieris rapae]
MARLAAACLFTVHFLSFIIVCHQDSSSNRSREQNSVSESSRRFRTEFLEDWPQTPGSPYFDPSTPDNVTGLVGHPVTLLCKVKNLQNRTVSWVRHRDIHLLTVGRYTYTSDQRFEAQHKQRSEEWALRIRSPQRRDSGQYECQISTTPPIGHAVYLSIVEPETEIMGGSDLFIYAGSTINLTCIVRHTPEPPNAINWSHRGKTINFDSTRGGISLVTEKGIHSSSRLLVQAARTSDAGAYECVPDNAQSASVRVHVLTGESPAAMQGKAHWIKYRLSSILQLIGALHLVKWCISVISN